MKTVFASGRHLAAARTLAGITQRELAERSGLHQNSVKFHEKKPSLVEGHAPERFAEALAKLGITIGIKAGHAMVRG